MASVTDYNDEEVIAIAALHGCEFYHEENSELWYVENVDGAVHPVEQENYRVHVSYGFETPPLLARAYCEFFNLL